MLAWQCRVGAYGLGEWARAGGGEIRRGEPRLLLPQHASKRQDKHDAVVPSCFHAFIGRERARTPASSSSSSSSSWTAPLVDSTISALRAPQNILSRSNLSDDHSAATRRCRSKRSTWWSREPSGTSSSCYDSPQAQCTHPYSPNTQNRTRSKAGGCWRTGWSTRPRPAAS